MGLATLAKHHGVQLLVGGLYLVQVRGQQSHNRIVAKLFSPGNQRAVTRDFIVFDRLTACDDRRIENGFVGDLAGDLVVFFQGAVDGGATRALRILITATDVPPPLR